jgi:hypothetical protein
MRALRKMTVQFPNSDLQRRFISVTNKVSLLSSLRNKVALQTEHDISERQWSAIESPLLAIEAKLHASLKKGGRDYLTHIHRAESQRSLAMLLGQTELALSKSFLYFDTFVDLLSQRHLPEVGLLLAGCDVLAWDALKKDHPALSLVEKPLVSFNRGFGASVIREGVPLPDGTANPLATIQIPYTKIKAKYNLTSIIHEAGHMAMVQLGLANILPKTIAEALENAGAPPLIRKLFALWCKEIGPDFWGFCNCGAAQASSAMEILTLPKTSVFRVSATDPHPPPFLRVLLAFEWCRQQWGSGDWGEWENRWLTIYPMDETSSQDRDVLAAGKRYLPVVSRALFHTQFSTLGNRTIPSLFDLNAIAPLRLENIVRSAADSGILNLSELSPCGQLALFRMLRNKSELSEQTLDRLMTTWLISLARGRKFEEPYS